jgi:hypothetical protein
VKARLLLALATLALVPALRADNKRFSPPPAAAAAAYPAHESHDDEKLSIAVDPFDTTEKAKIFKIKYRQKGFLPIRLIISNDGDNYLLLDDLKIQYITQRRDKIEPATTDDIYRRVVHLQQNPQDVEIPVPFPRRPSAPPVSKDGTAVQEELEQAQFPLFPVDPHSVRAGFLFFDINGLDKPEIGAHVYITGIKAGGKELFYFDIPLEKYLDSSNSKTR